MKSKARNRTRALLVDLHLAGAALLHKDVVLILPEVILAVQHPLRGQSVDQRAVIPSPIDEKG